MSSSGTLDGIALVLTIINGLNRGLIGVFSFDLVAALFGVMSPASRIAYALVGLASIWASSP